VRSYTPAYQIRDAAWDIMGADLQSFCAHRLGPAWHRGTAAVERLVCAQAYAHGCGMPGRVPAFGGARATVPSTCGGDAVWLSCVFWRLSCAGGHGVLLGAVGGVGGCRLSKHIFYEQASPLRHVCPIFQTFFCHPYAVYMHPNGFAHAHLVFCTPHGPMRGRR
jgi:hypothetical protein